MLTPDDVFLGIIAARDCHGYQLLAHFRHPDQLGRVWTLSTSQLYAVLKRLDQHGLIVGETITSSDAPPRTDYHLTPAGESRLQTWLYDPNPSPSVRRVRVEFLSRLYVARLLDQPTIPIIVAQRAACQRRLESLLTERDQTAPGVGFLALDLVIEQTQALLRWLDRCELRPLEDFES